MFPCHASALLRRTRFPVFAGIAALLHFASLGIGAPSSAAANGCPVAGPPAADAEAEALMAALERDFRRGARVVRMDVRTAYTRPHSRYYEITHDPNQKTLWGVFHGDAEQTQLLYVFSGPGRLAGTTLLIHDRTLMDEPDAMWLYMRSFDIFKTLEPETQHVMVPGTALTYGDSRGFLPLDRYRFTFQDGASSGESTPSQSNTPAPDGVHILACPRSASIRDDVGYRSLRLRVDPEKRIVRTVRYTGLGGRLLKTYTLVRDLRIGDRFFPGEVRVDHQADGMVTQIGYEYWLPETPPPPELFEPSTDSGPFIDRLKAYVTQIGEGERIRGELAKADERVRQFEDRLRRIQEAERLGRPFRE
jgi:hypothetical protein